MSAEVICGDCLEVMPSLHADSFDAIITDPPYGLSFMGKDWDRGVPGSAFWLEALRVTKAGSYLLAFGGTRTFHRLTCAIEDAGWEIQDCLSWLYGSGFPKHKSKLKPAWEPIIMARKKAPKATLLNIDACRIGVERRTYKGMSAEGSGVGVFRDDAWEPKDISVTVDGRWPANVLLDSEAAAVLDEQSGDCPTGARRAGVRQGLGYHGAKGGGGPEIHASSGGASRFFYTAKASRSERNAGLEGFAQRLGPECGVRTIEAGTTGGYGAPRANYHPTVKPIALMRWLCRLVTPQGGTILDPFTGSGTTGVAATLEGFRFVGIEKEAEYAEIARKRITETPPSLFGEVA